MEAVQVVRLDEVGSTQDEARTRFEGTPVLVLAQAAEPRKGAPWSSLDVCPAGPRRLARILAPMVSRHVGPAQPGGRPGRLLGASGKPPPQVAQRSGDRLGEGGRNPGGGVRWRGGCRDRSQSPLARSARRLGGAAAPTTPVLTWRTRSRWSGQTTCSGGSNVALSTGDAPNMSLPVPLLAEKSRGSPRGKAAQLTSLKTARSSSKPRDGRVRLVATEVSHIR